MTFIGHLRILLAIPFYCLSYLFCSYKYCWVFFSRLVFFFFFSLPFLPKTLQTLEGGLVFSVIFSPKLSLVHPQYTTWSWTAHKVRVSVRKAPGWGKTEPCTAGRKNHLSYRFVTSPKGVEIKFGLTFLHATFIFRDARMQPRLPMTAQCQLSYFKLVI